MTTRYNNGDEFTCRLERLFWRWSDEDKALYAAAREVMACVSTPEQAACEYDLDPDDVEELAEELYAYEAALDELTRREQFTND